MEIREKENETNGGKKNNTESKERIENNERRSMRK